MGAKNKVMFSMVPVLKHMARSMIPDEYLQHKLNETISIGIYNLDDIKKIKKSLLFPANYYSEEGKGP